MPRSPDQLGHSVSASPPDHIEPLLTEAPSQVLLRTYCTSIQGPLRAKFHPGNGPREISLRQPYSHALMPSLRQIGVEE
jgi:hypothetical protein